MVHLLVLLIKVQKKKKMWLLYFSTKTQSCKHPSHPHFCPTEYYVWECVCECVSRGMQIKNLSLYSDFKFPFSLCLFNNCLFFHHSPCPWKRWFLRSWFLCSCGNRMEKEMATHSSILAGIIPRQRSLAGLRPRGPKESDVTKAAEHAAKQRESRGLWSVSGSLSFCAESVPCLSVPTLSAGSHCWSSWRSRALVSLGVVSSVSCCGCRMVCLRSGHELPFGLDLGHGLETWLSVRRPGEAHQAAKLTPLCSTHEPHGSY